MRVVAINTPRLACGAMQVNKILVFDIVALATEIIIIQAVSRRMRIVAFQTVFSRIMGVFEHHLVGDIIMALETEVGNSFVQQIRYWREVATMTVFAGTNGVSGVKIQRGVAHDVLVAVDADQSRRKFQISRENGPMRIVALQTIFFLERRMHGVLLPRLILVTPHTKACRLRPQQFFIIRAMRRVTCNATFVLHDRIVEIVNGKILEIFVATRTQIEYDSA